MTSVTRYIFSSEQSELFEKSYEQEVEEKCSRKVECPGMIFEIDNPQIAQMFTTEQQYKCIRRSL